MHFKTKIKVYIKNVFVLLKMVDVDNNKLMGLLIIDGGSLFLTKNIIEKTKKMGASSGKKKRQYRSILFDHK